MPLLSINIMSATGGRFSLGAADCRREFKAMAVDHSWQAVFKPGASNVFFRAGHPAHFNSAAEGFSPINAWWLSELARLIYKKDYTEGVAGGFSRADILARVGLIERQFFSRPNSHAALVETLDDDDDAAFAVLVFRGTTGGMANWIFNLDILPCPWPTGGKVHRGFGRLIRSVWESIDAALQTVTKPLYYTGHSMGGALATLAASLRPPRAVYTFGAPRIGDAAFAETLANVPVFNVFNPQDIVTHLPPAGRFSGFTHVGAIVRNCEVYLPHRAFLQAPSFLAGHAPLNYTAQLPVAFEN
jgi:triacylglycerol lipase